MEFPHHFEELRPSNVLQRNKARLSEESVTASV
jgi:hypothetical protein